MRRRLEHVVPVSFLAAALSALSVAGLGLAAPSEAVAAVEVQTVPPVEGVRFSYRGKTVRADSLGRVRLNVSTTNLQRQVKVTPTPVSRGVRAGLDRWYPKRGVAAIAFFHRVRPRFINLQGNAVDARLVDAVRVKGSHGEQHRFRHGEREWLQVSRVVPRRGGRLRSQSLRYSVQRVTVRGSNVVNAGQQRFRPAKTPEFPIQLLLYSARFKTRDAFFGFPIGSAVRLEYPNGRVERHELGENGELLVPTLPRSDYKVTVDGPGFSFSRPVRLSRNQEVELEVLSYLDVGLALFVMAAFALGLPLLRRPALRSALRRSASGVTLPRHPPGWNRR
jgi:hypothetical protein